MNNEKGFTLAEVLITLGVIGVVAAVTMPVLIQNYKKQVTVTRLKHDYSVLSQALLRAQSEHGDTSNWGLSDSFGNSNTVNREEILTDVVDKYIRPNIDIADDYGYGSGSTLNYYFYYPSESTARSGDPGYFFTLKNGSLIKILLDGPMVYDDDGNASHKKYTMIMFLVDINGFKKPNTLGKDIFKMSMSNSYQFRMYGGGVIRNNLLNDCKSHNAEQCGALIQSDGWKISDDYPYKL